MSKNIVTVQYQDKDNPDEYRGREYAYLTDIDLAAGDIVIAPTWRGDSVARVSAANVPESKVDERIMPLLKTITAKYEGPGVAAPGQEQQNGGNKDNEGG